MPVQVPSDSVCLQCKYRLYGLPEPRCLECGREFDPSESATYLASNTPRWANLLTSASSIYVAVGRQRDESVDSEERESRS